MSKRDFQLLFGDILDAINKIEVYTEGMDYRQFKDDSKTVDAVIRNIEIIGEAANQFPISFQEVYPDIEWRRIVGLRNRIVHEYFGVDLEIIWEIISKELKPLKYKIKAISES